MQYQVSILILLWRLTLEPLILCRLPVPTRLVNLVFIALKAKMMKGDSIMQIFKTNKYLYILFGSVLLTISSYAWAGLDYHLTVNNYTDTGPISLSWESENSSCINSVSSVNAIPNGSSAELTIATNGSGDCAFTSLGNTGAYVTEFLYVTDETNNTIAEATMKFNMVSVETSSYCVNYSSLEWTNPLSPKLAITQAKKSSEGYNVAHIVINVCLQGDTRCDNDPFSGASTCLI